MLTISDPIKRQLVRTKFLLEFGLAPHLARNSDADNVIAVILLDYCVESLLKTAMTAAGVSPPGGGNLQFGPLWKLIEEKVIKEQRFGLTITQLPFRIELTNLHQQRNGTQHESRTPNAADVERDVVVVREFARQIYREVFGLDYQTVTLIDLVRNEKLRKILLEAESLLNSGKWRESAVSSAEAMTRLLGYASAYSPMERPVSLFGIANGIPGGQTHVAVEKLVTAVEEVRDGLTRQMQIVLGLDFKNYARYRHFAPNVAIMMAGNIRSAFRNEDLTPEESKWILEFVLGNILRMEEAGLEWHKLG